VSETINVYCDESCHLEHDGQPVMVLGAVWCLAERAREIAVRLREIKERHDLSPKLEIKWVSVSPSKVDFFRDVVDYFFDNDDLHFRALVADKTGLRHNDFGQSHDEWYYKMYYDMLKVLLRPENRHRIYIDIKDTRGAAKAEKLREILCNSMLDFDRRVIDRLQNARSHEIEQLQLTDLLTGLVGYANRQLDSSSAKTALVARMRKRSGYALDRTTLLGESKVNIFHWSGGERVS